MTQIPNFTIRCSAIHQIMAGNIGLTDTQQEELDTLVKRHLDSCNRVPGVKPLTDNMTTKVRELTEKKNNPELPTGAKTYCKKWLKEQLFHRYREISSKYIEKGNATEEEGFTTLAITQRLGMVKKNEDFKTNGFICGTCDLDHNGVVYDNKSCWDLESFPMFETAAKSEHEWQVLGYMELWDRSKAVVGYTLNDATEKMLWDAVRWYDDLATRARVICNMVYTPAGWERAAALFFEALPITMYPTFVPIPEADRVKVFPVMRDNIKIGSIYHRVNMCNSYIQTLISN